jgi:hypothetical protein
MKKLGSMTGLILAVLMTMMLVACGSSSQNTTESGGAPAAEATTQAEVAKNTEAPVEETIPEVLAETEEYTKEDMVGEYKGFAAMYMGYTYSLEETKGTSNLTLSEDGTGKIDFDGNDTAITEWTVEGNTLHITDDQGSKATGIVEHDVINLDLLGDGSANVYYAKEGTDTSWVEILSVDEIKELVEKGPGTKTFDAYSAINVPDGVHLSYDLHTDLYDANMHYEVNAKDGVYASSRNTKVKGVESTTITFYKDGKVYNLNPDDKTGRFVTETTLLENNLVGMDSLYQALSRFYLSNKYTEETRDYEGESYTVEVYPEGKYNGETAFYYDKDGKLAYVDIKSYTAGSTEVPAQFFTIKSIDNKVDESTLDMSAYTIEE